MNPKYKRRLCVLYHVPRGEFEQTDYSPSAMALFVTAGLYWSVIDTLKWAKKKNAWVNGEKEIVELGELPSGKYFQTMYIHWTA